MNKYQHFVITLPTADEAPTLEKTNRDLNDYGSKGWELVAVVPDSEQVEQRSFFYFKRRVE